MQVVPGLGRGGEAVRGEAWPHTRALRFPAPRGPPHAVTTPHVQAPFRPPRSGGEGGLRARGDPYNFAPLADFAPLVSAFVPPALRPDRMLDVMGALMPPEARALLRMSPRALERDLSRGLQETVGIADIKLDIAETREAYVIHAEVPGVPKENLKASGAAGEGAAAGGGGGAPRGPEAARSSPGPRPPPPPPHPVADRRSTWTPRRAC